ncbi:hypothetical protein FPRO05_13151 [Fusarium proliferatum]|uniref:Uncharacterized protein n=1 Tax=Gibberella intermedia TaxID=948311 RepID=A0A365N2I3_GIBIN|nr:hypothetical protein FPRO05_13151 [Fusarium proliferatum]
MLQFSVNNPIMVSLANLKALMFGNEPPALTANDSGHPLEIRQLIKRNQLLKVSRLLKASKLLELGHMQRFQDIDPALYEWGEAPLLILFISHRWASPSHPDPEGEHLHAIHFLLNAIKDLASVYHSPLEDRIKKVKTLKVHGYLQAARVLSKIASEKGTIDSTILSRIGLWIDFMCLPQKNTFRVDDRTADELVFFKEGLRLLPSLIVSCDYVVSLRQDDDDYIERAWCISELCVSWPNKHNSVIVLRKDLLGQPIDGSLLRTEQLYSGLEALRQGIESWECCLQYEGSLDFDYGMLEIVEEDLIKSYEQATQGNPNIKKLWPTPFLTTGRPPLIFPNQIDFLLHIRQSLRQAPPRNIALLITITMKECGMSCYDINDYTRCGLHIAYSRLWGHGGWELFFKDCLIRLSNREPLILRDVAEVEMTNGIDSGGVVTYRFETDQRILSLHARATEIWKNQHLHEDPKKTALLLEAMLRQLKLLGKAYEENPGLGIMELSELVENAMEVAEIECEESKVELGLSLLYAKCQWAFKIQLPGAERISTFLLEALERLRDDQRLWITAYRCFNCSYATELTTDLLLLSFLNMFRIDELKLDLKIAATGLPVLDLT